MMLRKSMMLYVALILIFALVPGVHADSSWKNVQERGKIIVGFCAQYPPFESKNEKTGEFEGFDVDLGKALAEQLGVSVKFVDSEWQGLLGGLKKGDYDMLLTCMSKSETREENVSFSDVYYELPRVIVVSKKNDAIKSKADLKGKVVGEPLAEAQIVMVIPKGADALTAKINSALSVVKSNGAYQKIYDRWLKID